MNTKVGDTALEILGKTKSQLAFHALESAYKFVDEISKNKINKALSSLKILVSELIILLIFIVKY